MAYQKETLLEPGSRCQYCEGGGELILCDGCPRAYHPICLRRDELPSVDSTVLWHCPVCSSKILSDERTIKTGAPGYLMILASKSVQSGETGQEDALRWVNAKENENKLKYEAHTSLPSTLRLEANNLQAYDAMDPSGKLTIDQAQSGEEQPEPLPEKRMSRRDVLGRRVSDKSRENDQKAATITRGRGSSSGWGGNAHISVGNTFQIHGLKATFLEGRQVDCVYDEYQKRLKGDLPQKKLRPRLLPGERSRVISTKSLATPIKPAPLRTCHRLCQLVWSKEVMKSVALKNSPSSGYITNQQGIDYYLEQCQRDWPKMLLYPFQEEFALQVLYNVDFNTELAYQIIQSPDFDFARLCHPSTQPYLNKWHPRHLRGNFLSLPFQWKLGNLNQINEDETNAKRLKKSDK